MKGTITMKWQKILVIALVVLVFAFIALVLYANWSVNKAVDSLVSDYTSKNVAPRIAESAEQFTEDADDIVFNLDKSLLESMREQAEADGKTPEEIEKFLATAEEVLAQMKK